MSFMFPKTAVRAPNLEKIEEKAKEKLRRGMKERKSILTTPLGVAGEAPTRRPSLLGG